MPEEKGSWPPEADSLSPGDLDKLDPRDRRDLETKGYAHLYASQRETPETPEGYEGILVEGIFSGTRDLIAYDPQRVDIEVQNTTEMKEGGKQKMLDAGWDLVDANIARFVWIRTKESAEA